MFPLYSVSLRRRDDRRASFCLRLPSDYPVIYSFDIGGDYDHLALHGHAPNGVGLFPWKISHDNPWWSRPLKLGEICCALNHHACWRHAAGSRERHFLFFEDDAVFPASLFTSIDGLIDKLYAIDPRWDLLYLGREKLGVDIRLQFPFVKPGFSYCTHAYICTRTGLDKLLSYAYLTHLIPVDEFLVASYMSHPRADVRSLYHPSLRVYAVADNLVEQAATALWGSDTEDSSYVCPTN